MKRIIAVLIIWLASFIGPSGAASTDDNVLRSSVYAMIDAYTNEDVDAFAQYVLPTVEGFDVYGNFPTVGFQPEVLQRSFDEGFTPNIEIVKVRVLVFGSHASVTVELDGVITGATGFASVGPWRMPQLWKKQAGVWKLAHYHGFPLLPAGARAWETQHIRERSLPDPAS